MQASPRATLVLAAVLGSVVSCTSNTPSGNVGLLTCATPGSATPGPLDMHCAGQPAQPVDMAVCNATSLSACEVVAATAVDGATDDGQAASDEAGSADDASLAQCPYGATMFGPAPDAGSTPVEGDDDDCKYHVSWTSTPICRSSVLGVIFTVTVTNKQTGEPVTNIPLDEGVLPEAFIPTAPDAACDDFGTHVSPTPFGVGGNLLATSDPGVYQGPVVFDEPGEWTLRFHIHEECSDYCDDSPHGHAAFHITVP